ncbi:hypothetical protein [Cellulomonas composti]|uniref:Uncharacterized protein n=1 Tax=Cellulomonas composti TaxID=266130 RepID=A0A511J7I3_9CELL|nr:hypothetical protein [Cellulomonas composti]GEL93972.1 hypothetical protein CCO02nite_06300 [Cellulomonas composti]
MHKHEADEPALVPPAPDHVLDSGTPDPVIASAPHAEPASHETEGDEHPFPPLVGSQTGAVPPPEKPVL